MKSSFSHADISFADVQENRRILLSVPLGARTKQEISSYWLDQFQGRHRHEESI